MEMGWRGCVEEEGGSKAVSEEMEEIIKEKKRQDESLVSFFRRTLALSPASCSPLCPPSWMCSPNGFQLAHIPLKRGGAQVAVCPWFRAGRGGVGEGGGGEMRGVETNINRNHS
jgi:hypothetical protein